jgi:hypothetical protein
MPIVERQLTARGWARIVAVARDAGLLGERSSFGETMPGQEILRLQIVADGRAYDLTAPNTAIPCVGEPCHGAPGTREAFMFMVSQLNDLESWLFSDIGKQGPSRPEGYAIIVGAVPDDHGLPRLFVDWPFPDGFGAFGKPFADDSGFRCGALHGWDAMTFFSLLKAANQMTTWRDPVDGSFHGLTVQPLLPGDGDPCAGMV